MAGTGNAASPRRDPWKWLASKKWAGPVAIATIVAAAATVLGLFVSLSGGSTTNNQNGNTCSAQGSGNTVNCTTPGARPSR